MVAQAGARHAHGERHNEQKVQHDVQRAGEAQEIQRRFAVAHGAQQAGEQIVKQARAQPQKDDADVCALSLKMFSGVFMARSIGSVPRKLAAVATAVTMRDSSIVMATHRRSPASSRAPKRCDTTTRTRWQAR